MLTVDRQQYRTAATNGLHKQIAGHDQRFFIGQENFFASVNRCQRRTQTSCTHDCCHDRVNFWSRSHLTQALLTHPHFSAELGGLQTGPQLAGCMLVRHHNHSRLVFETQGQKLRNTAKTAQAKDLIAVRVTCNNIQGAQANRACSPQHRNLLRSTHDPAIQSSTANNGTAAVRLSIRSRTPP